MANFDRLFAAVAFRQTRRAITLALGSGGSDGSSICNFPSDFCIFSG
jgi:hypothetical protein